MKNFKKSIEFIVSIISIKSFKIYSIIQYAILRSNTKKKYFYANKIFTSLLIT